MAEEQRDVEVSDEDEKAPGEVALASSAEDVDQSSIDDLFE